MSLKLFNSILILVFICAIVFCRNHYIKINNKQPHLSNTLDSLQGVWKGYDDTFSVFKINGRYRETFYNDTGSNYYHDISKIYFSETPILLSNLDSFPVALIDTSLKSGKYIVYKSLSSANDFCIEKIEGFYIQNSDTFLDLSYGPKYKGSEWSTYKKSR